MVLLSLAASHHDLDLDVLERLSSDVQAVASELVHSAASVSGAVVLATCNRFELYLEVDDAQDAPLARSVVAETVSERSGYTTDQVASHLRVRVGTDAASHLFAVASGLDSMVVGEREIAGQVRRALTTARRDGTTTSGLESSSRRRPASRATSRRAPAWGPPGARWSASPWTSPRRSCPTGPTSGACSSARGPTRAPPWPSSRPAVAPTSACSTTGRARAFAAARGVRALPAGADLAAEVSDVDLVVACSGAAGAVLGVDALAAARTADARPLTVVDLALRHDVDPGVRSLPGVRLVSLHTVSEYAPAEHAAVEAAHAVVTAAAVDYEADRRVRDWNPAVVAERTRVLGGLEHELVDLSDERAVRALRRRTRAALHGPTVRAREAARAGDPATYAQALAELASIPVPSLTDAV